jgi:hypothetical protein
MRTLVEQQRFSRAACSQGLRTLPGRLSIYDACEPGAGALDWTALNCDASASRTNARAAVSSA